MKKVRFIDTKINIVDLTYNKIYEVLIETTTYYIIKDNKNKKIACNKERFKIV